MPDLPDIELYQHALQNHVVGQTIVASNLHKKTLHRNETRSGRC